MAKKQKDTPCTDKEKMFRMADALRAVRIPASEISEHDKMNLIRERFENIDEDDLMDGQEFFDLLDAEDKDA